MELAVGNIVEGKVTGVTNFGAFVDVGENQTGMVHISEIASTYVKEISDYVATGDTVKVKVIKIEDDGKIALSIKQALPEGEQQEVRERPPQRKPQRRKEAPVIGVKNSFANKPKQPSSDSFEFEDLMSQFKQSSDDKMLDIKRNLEAKKGGRGGSKRGGK